MIMFMDNVFTEQRLLIKELLQHFEGAMRMIELSVSIEMVKKRLDEIFDFIYDEETGESLEDKLNNAWHEVFGMQGIFTKANVKSFDDATVAIEYNDIRKAFSDALATIEHLYDEQVTGKN